jgi:hypothetical protein
MPARKTLKRYKNYNVKTETPENDLCRSGISQEILWRPLIRRHRLDGFVYEWALSEQLQTD